MAEIHYRWARVEEWASAMTMVWKTFMEFEGKEYSRKGIRHFFDFITDDRLYRSFLKGNYQMLVAEDEGAIVGVATIRNGHHLSLLFVEEAHQRRNIGGTLLQILCSYLQTEAGESLMTLTAAPSALAFYLKQGFAVMGPEEEHDGISVVSMEKRFINS